jgi:hypothetical protein
MGSTTEICLAFELTRHLPLAWMVAGANVRCEGVSIAHCGNPERSAYAPGDVNPQELGSLSAITVIGSEVTLSKCNLTQCRYGEEGQRATL